MRRIGSTILLVGIVVAMLALDPAMARATPTGQPQAVDAKIEIVWPHDEQGRYSPVETADRFNVAIYLFISGTLEPVPCSFDRPVHLWSDGIQRNARPGEARKVIRRVDGKTMPVWELNDFDAASLRETRLATHLFVTVDGVASRSNVWTHAVDARTILSNPITRPTGQSPESYPTPLVVGSEILVVWPHDQQGRLTSVSSAPLVNVRVQIVWWERRTYSQALAMTKPVRLYRAIDNGFLEEVGIGQMRSVPQNLDPSRPSATGPVYEFNDLDVSGTGTGRRYTLLALADDTITYPQVWVHAVDARTYLPRPDIPSASGAGCPTN